MSQECRMLNAECRILGSRHSAFCILHSCLLFQGQPFHFLQNDAQNTSQCESLRETVRYAHARPAQLEEVERRLAPRQDVHELAGEVFAVVGVEVQRLQVVAEMHRAQRRRPPRELRQGDAERDRAEDPVLLRELTTPEVFLVLRQFFEAHRQGSSSRKARVFGPAFCRAMVWQPSSVSKGFPDATVSPSSCTRPRPKRRTT